MYSVNSMDMTKTTPLPLHRQWFDRTAIHLKTGEELVGVLVLPHVDRLPVVVLERRPEVLRRVARRSAELQVREHPLQTTSANDEWSSCVANKSPARPKMGLQMRQWA